MIPTTVSKVAVGVGWGATSNLVVGIMGAKGRLRAGVGRYGGRWAGALHDDGVRLGVLVLSRCQQRGTADPQATAAVNTTTDRRSMTPRSRVRSQRRWPAATVRWSHPG